MGSQLEDPLVVEVRFSIEKDHEGYPSSRDSEALLCKPLDAECTECVVASVPFYLRNVAYGDTIKVEEGPTRCLEFKEILKRGGFSVYRILLHDSTKREVVITKLLEFDTLLEQSGDLIAIAVPPTANVDAIVDYLLDGKREGFWGTQDGYIFEKP